ncbi:hypothetical protein [Bradyrhizobium sp. WU425]|uniref:hypothetical protein n=1 Tax=Bradyrhizobium sp. WU425 TaxID=187029 RepID=UPI001E39EEB3|nr:hypothetical protein [Bradyrhizobium canariense]UFW75486.1 hypothetical protein BcanWU425_17645 [Bradyrhizobium canariense]
MSENSEKRSEAMTSEVALREASNLIRQLAGDGCPGESVKSILRRLERRLKNWTPARVKSIWYADPRVAIRGEELEQLRGLVEPRNDGANLNELEELRSTVARLAKYESLLEHINAEFFGPEISATRDQLGQARSLLGKGRV